MRQLTSLMGNSQQLDGGAMFGSVPKALWQRWIQADADNRIPLCCRCLLIQEADRNILLETGIGYFFEPKLQQRYGVVEAEHRLLTSLQAVGLTDADIDVVILSHLHFDHAGGLLSAWQAGQAPQLLFPNAQFVVSRRAWERAQQPHPRDRASFIPALNDLLKASERLVITDSTQLDLLGEDYSFYYSDGHTPGMLHTEIAMPDGPIFFAADLIPGTPWVHLPITMGYDRAAEQLIDEKQQYLNDLLSRNGRIFYTHDHQTALSAIGQDDTGRFTAIQTQLQLQALSR